MKKSLTIIKKAVCIITLLLVLAPDIAQAGAPNAQPNQDSYLDTTVKLVGIAGTVISAGGLVMMLRKLYATPNIVNYHVDWTKSSQTSKAVTLTNAQEKFLFKLLRSIDDHANPHAVITGNAGSGKTTIIRAFASKIRNKNSMIEDTPFANAVVWSVDADALNDSGVSGQTSRRLKAVWDSAKQQYEKTGQKVILFFDEFHRLMQIGNHSASTAENLSEVLKTLTGNTADYCGVHIIGATTKTEYRQYLAPTGSETAITRRFPAHPLPQLNTDDAALLLRDIVQQQELKHLVLIEPKNLTDICKQCIKHCKKQWKNPNLDQYKASLREMIITFKEKQRVNEAQEVKGIHEEIGYLRRRIAELKEHDQPSSNTWFSWKNRAKKQFTGDETTSEIINFAIMQIQSVFGDKPSRKHQENNLQSYLWGLSEVMGSMEELSGDQKSHIQKRIIQELEQVLHLKEGMLEKVKQERTEIKEGIEKRARLKLEIHRLKQEAKEGALICSCPMTQEQQIDKAIADLERQLPSDIEPQLQNHIITPQGVSEMLRKIKGTGQDTMSTAVRNMYA